MTELTGKSRQYLIDLAAARVRQANEAQHVYALVLSARDESIRGALSAAPDDMSDNELARQIGVSGSTRVGSRREVLGVHDDRKEAR